MFKFKGKVKSIEIQGMMLIGNEDIHVLYELFCKELDEKPDVYSVFIHYYDPWENGEEDILDITESDLERIADCETFEKAEFIAKLVQMFYWNHFQPLNETPITIFYTDVPGKE
jgi:hypothetical protein